MTSVAEDSAWTGVLAIPEFALVALMGASSSGKSTFGRRLFGQYEVVSSDFCRGLVADDENDQSATSDALDVLNYIAGKRLAAGRLTVIDATNVEREAQRQLVDLAQTHGVPLVAIVLDMPEDVCLGRHADRSDRDFESQVRAIHLTGPLQVIPEGTGPCQGLGDLRFGLSWIAAHTSK